VTGNKSILDVLNELIAEGEALVPQGGSSGYNDKMQPEYVSWRHRSIATIQELGRLAAAILKDLEGDKSGPYFYRASAGRVLGSLRAAVAIAQRHGSSSNSTSPEIRHVPDLAGSRRVFLVHGHDRALLEQAARFLEKLDVEPVILFEAPGAGRTIIEKLEHSSDVRAAVVLLTPDDVGKAAADAGDAHPRARQNVILELGYFLGRLGRDKVAVLFDESVELPSDYRGVEYIKVDAEGAWKLKLARELNYAGIHVDMNKAL
jgi:predicted nucleotide-binding protein